MQRSKIKIGGEYGVLARYTTKRQYEIVCKATVTALGAKYKKFVGTWSRTASEFNDGIEVVFDEDVVQQYDRFVPVSSFVKNYNPDRRDVIKAGTKVVLDSPKLVIAEWAPIAESRAQWAIDKQEAADEIDAAGDITEPVVEEIEQAIARFGLAIGRRYENGDVNISKTEVRGNGRQRITDASYTLTLEAMAKLLGVSVAAS